MTSRQVTIGATFWLLVGLAVWAGLSLKHQSAGESPPRVASVVQADPADYEREIATLAEPAKAALARYVAAEPDTLNDCRRAADPMNCILDQTQLAHDWERAWKGDLRAARGVSLAFDPEAGGGIMVLHHGGVKPAPLRACAWRVAILSSGSSDLADFDAEMVRKACASLSADEQSVARSQAAKLLGELPPLRLSRT